MSETVAAHVAHGLALGGVLAIAGAWSHRARNATLPHLGVGAVAGVAVALGGRLAAVPPWATVLLVLLAGAGCGRLAWSLDTRVRSVPDRPAVTADVAVLGAAVATVGLLVPVGAAPAVYPPLSAAVLPSGVPVLGGWPGLPGGLAALVLGGAAAWLLASRLETQSKPPAAHWWAVAGAALAGAAVLGGGALFAGDPGARGGLLAAADPVGLAVRAAAAAIAGRASTRRAAAAGFALGIAETLARVLDPTGALVLLPAVGVVLVSVILAWDGDPDRPAGPGDRAMSADPVPGALPAGPRRRRALAAGFVVAVAWPFVLAGPAAWRTASQALALMLVGLSLTVTVGWLRVIALFAPASAVAGAGATVVLVARNRPVLAFAAAAVAGALTGLLALAPASGNPRRWLPLTSLVITVAGALVLPRLFRPVTPPARFGVDLTDDRVLYLVGLAVVIAAIATVACLARSSPGRCLAAIGAGEPAAGSQRWWVAGVALSGGLAGAAGYLTTLLHHGVPSPMEFAPTTAVVYLAIPFVGGAATVGGALVGAVVFLAAARTSLALGLASVTLPATLLVAAVSVRHGGLLAWMGRRVGDRR